jgi:hypothetical protein
MVYEGGKQPIPKPQEADPKGTDWLRELGHGARFVCHPKHSIGCFLDMYGVAFVMDECILLLKNPGTLGGELSWVQSDVFSQHHKLVAVLPEQPDKEAGKHNGHHLLGPADSSDHDDHEGSS